MGCASRYRRSVALLAALVLLVTAAAPARAQAPASFVDPVLGLVTLCTPGSGAAAQDNGAPPQHTPEHCSFCTLPAPSALPAAEPAATAFLFPVAGSAAPKPQDVCTLADHLGPGGIRSRAPPLQA